MKHAYRWTAPLALSVLSACGGSHSGSTPPPGSTAPTTYTIGGSITGLTAAGLVLANGSDTASPAANATSYTLSTGLAGGTMYNVMVTTQPTGETCTVANATGPVGSANVTNVNVSCTANTPPVTYTIGGTIEGLTAAGLVLQDNGGDNYSATAGTAFSFTFATPLAGGAAYAVTVEQQPTGETCIVVSGTDSGNVASANVTSVIVSCSVYAANLGSNVVAVTVGNGPAAATSPVFNIPYVTVKVCEPGTSTCAIINNVEVDTGSVGLRVLASALAAPDSGSPVSLTTINDPVTHADTISECWYFGGDYDAWGPVATADVTMGSETASNVEVQVINGDTPPGTCGDVQFSTVSDFDANGVLGVGVMQQDCGTGCETVVSAGNYYYTCTSSSPSSCTAAGLTTTAQVPNPVTDFADNNGIILQLPAVPDAGLPTANGYLVFGIGTQSDNALPPTPTVLTADPAYSTFTTIYNNAPPLTAGNGTGGIIDSGSNALFFPNGTTTNMLDTCTGGAFYCPGSPASLSAQNENYDGSGTLSTVDFTIDSLANLSSDNYALDDVGGPTTGSFDWGLPFFYGRAVFVAIEGEPPGAGDPTGPYYAY